MAILTKRVTKKMLPKTHKHGSERHGVTMMQRKKPTAMSMVTGHIKGDEVTRFVVTHIDDKAAY
jgi:hypothetical protein